MKCNMCENKKPLKKQYVSVKYKDCGLDNVTLANVESYRCDQCGEEYLGYGNMEKLHQVIAYVLLRKKGLLTGKEVRFLRSSVGYSGARFAKLLGYDAATVSRVETGAQKMTESFDRIVRFAVSGKMPDRDYDLHDQILNEGGKKFSRIELTPTSDGDWKAELAA